MSNVHAVADAALHGLESAEPGGKFAGRLSPLLLKASADPTQALICAVVALGFAQTALQLA